MHLGQYPTPSREDDPRHLVPMRNLLFWNGGRERGFFEAGAAGGAALAVENVGRGSADCDYDGDGETTDGRDFVVFALC